MVIWTSRFIRGAENTEKGSECQTIGRNRCWVSLNCSHKWEAPLDARQLSSQNYLWSAERRYEEPAMMRMTPGDFSDPRVIDLLHLHKTSAQAETARGSAHALDLTGLQSPNVSFWTIWEGEILLGI